MYAVNYTLLVVFLGVARIFAGCSGVTIHVNKEGSDNVSCLNGSSNCASVDYALNGTSGESNITFVISEGEFELRRAYVFDQVSSVAFDGQGAELTTLVCKKDPKCSLGIAFVNSSNITFKGLEIKGCGIKRRSTSTIDGGKTMLPLTTALYFERCSDVAIMRVSLNMSVRIGVTMYDTSGEVTIDHCRFVNSGAEKREGTGLYVETTYCNNSGKCPPISEAHYRVHSSIFEGNADIVNEHNITYILPNKGRHFSFGRGGGISVFFRGSAFNNSFTIEDCNFADNVALWGGGVFASFQDDASDNLITISRSNFSTNHAGIGPFPHPIYREENKGSSLHASFVTFTSAQLHGNGIVVNGCHFAEPNQTISVFEVASDNSLTVTHMKRFHNMFHLMNADIYTSFDRSSAVSVISLSGKSSQLVCKLTNVNIMRTTVKPGNDRDITEAQLQGFKSLLYFQNIAVYIGGKIVLDSSNTGQGVFAVDSKLIALPGSEITIKNNLAISGGGVALHDSFLEVHPNISLVFSNNRALKNGGAIYSTFTPTRSPYLRLCFMHYHDITVQPEHWANVSISFVNNTAMWKGHVIYATLLRNCFWGRAYGPSKESFDTKIAVFGCKDVFHYEPKRNFSGKSLDIATGAAYIHYHSGSASNSMGTVNFIPGKVMDLSNVFTVANDFNTSSKFTPFSVQLFNHNQSTLKIKEEYHFIDTFQIQLHGYPFTQCKNDNTTPILNLQSLEDYTVTYSLYINMLCCPPGFKFNNGTMTCECANLEQVLGKCNSRKFTARISQAYWLGYLDDNISKSCDGRILWGGKCPSGFCSHDISLPLPETDNETDLNNLMCDKNNRQGILCGECKSDYCNPINVCSSPCKLSADEADGWWKWILTETMPLTIFIILILLFDINLLSGPLNSYLLYAQFIAVIYASEHWIPFEKQYLQANSSTFDYSNRSLNNTLISIYGILTVSVFNLDFFSTILKPFCLIEDSSLNALHLIGIKFLFKLYPIAIILLFVLGFWVHKKISCRCHIGRYCPKICRKLSWRSIIHALAAIFVLNYAGFLRWATAILTLVKIFPIGSNSEAYHVYFHGVWTYNDPSYLELAVPVVIAVIFFNLPISILLFACYPVVTNLGDSMQKSSNRVLNQLHNSCIVRLLKRNWIRQTAELFQRPYKAGAYKCFAGFLLLFRIPLVVVIMMPNEYRYLGCTVLLVFLIVIHSFFQPNEKQWINVIDWLVYANMILISVMYSYKKTAVMLVNDGDSDEHVQDQEAFDKGLLFVEILPTFYLCGYLLHFPIKLIWQRCLSKCCKGNVPHNPPDVQPILEGNEYRRDNYWSIWSSESK
jgi:predicted outer membrane repeat protein